MHPPFDPAPLDPAPLQAIIDFGDAVSAAFGLHHLYRRAQAVIALDHEGSIVEVEVAPGADQLDELLELECFLYEQPEITTLLFVSVTTDDITELNERHIATFNRARRRFDRCFGSRRVEVRDWLLINDDELRSMAYSCLTDDPWPEPQSQ